MVKVNAYANFDQIPSIRSQNIDRKRNSDDNQGSYLYCKFTKKMTCNNPNRDVVKVNTYAKFDQIPLIHSQDIEQKQNPHDNQGP